MKYRIFKNRIILGRYLGYMPISDISEIGCYFYLIKTVIYNIDKNHEYSDGGDSSSKLL
jgi:hypothetical protein